MRIGILIISLLLKVLGAQSQEYAPVYSQYMLNGLAINPAYAGSKETFTTNIMHRSQWLGFEGAPVTQTLSAHAPLKSGSIALGILVFNEKIGVSTNTGIYTNYVYRFGLWNGKFAFGFKAGASFAGANYRDIHTSDGQIDEVFASNVHDILPNFGVGFYYYSNHVYFGGSVPLMLSYNHISVDNRYQMSHKFADYNFLVTSGVLIVLNSALKLKPSFLMKYHKYSPIQLDVNGNLIIKDFLWIGTSYRLQDALVGIVECQVNEQLKVGYSYDYSFGDLQKYNSGSHEILVQYEFGYKIRAVDPRYF